MKHPALHSLVALLALALLISPARAEDTPTATYAARRAALPAPSAEAGFHLEGAFVMGGNAVGSFRMAAEPTAASDGKPGWVVHTKVDAFGGALATDERSLFDAHLKPLRGTSTTKKGGPAETLSWEAVGTGVRLGEGDEARLLEHEGPFLTSMASLILYCRLVGHAPGSQATDLFDADAAKFVTGTWTTGAEGTWNGAKARLVTGQRADGKTIEVGFDAATGDVLGVKAGDAASGAMFEFRPGEAPKPAAEQSDLFDRPAKTAQEAAVQGGLSLATADFDLLERVTHWPSIAKTIQAQSPETAAMDEAAIKELVMAQLRSTLKPKGDRAVLAPLLTSLAPSLAAEKGEDGTTLVAFGAAFGNLVLAVGEFDGRWYLVRFPNR